MKLRELQKEFEKKGVKYFLFDKKESYTQEENGKYKTEGYVIYKCSALSYKDKYFEVFKYRIAKPHPHDVENWDMVELYPGDEQFGTWAWCCQNEESLKMIMKEEFGIEYKIQNN